MADWESGTPIVSYDSQTFNGQWVPAVEIYLNEMSPDGYAHQQFILHDGTPDNRVPIDRVSQDPLDLTDPKTLIDQWKTINKRPDDGAGD